MRKSGETVEKVHGSRLEEQKGDHGAAMVPLLLSASSNGAQQKATYGMRPEAIMSSL